MKHCKDCKNFGVNLDKNSQKWCWSDGRKCSKNEGACIIFEPKEEVKQ